MASIFKRISDVISANLNDLIDRVEDPERMIKQIIREMEENISKAKEGVIEAIASEKQLQKDLEQHRRQSSEWQKKAEEALQVDKEELARAALIRKKEHDNIIKALEPSWEAAKNTSERLKTLANFQAGLDAQANFARMEDKVTEMEARVEAAAELHSDASQLEKDFLAMEVEQEVDNELAALKRKVAGQQAD